MQTVFDLFQFLIPWAVTNLVMDGFQAGDINRTQSEEVQFGGKGINVSTVLRNLGIQNVALGFLAGFTGQALEQGLRESGIQTDFIWLPEGLTRINVKIKAGEETEINGRGPAIPAAALEQLFGKLDCLQSGDVLDLSGSIPTSLPNDVWPRRRPPPSRARRASGCSALSFCS